MHFRRDNGFFCVALNHTITAKGHDCTCFRINVECFHLPFQRLSWDSSVECHNGSDVDFDSPLIIGFVVYYNADVEAVTHGNVIQNFQAEFHVFCFSFVNIILLAGAELVSELNSFPFFCRTYQEGRGEFLRTDRFD